MMCQQLPKLRHQLQLPSSLKLFLSLFAGDLIRTQWCGVISMYGKE